MKNLLQEYVFEPAREEGTGEQEVLQSYELLIRIFIPYN
jgi:hypothetical protein